MTLKDGDEVMSLSILRRSGADQDERDAYLRAAPWKDNENAPTLSAERMAEMAEREQFILTVCANGYGKRSSAYEYRRTGRGGQGITNIDNLDRNGPVVASFPAKDGEHLMLRHRSGQDDPHGSRLECASSAATPAACACSMSRTMNMW
jgi:DNA gyrase subunit A